MSNSKETMTKKQQDDLAATFNNLPWGLPLGFPTMPSFNAFPPFGLPTSTFPTLNSFTSSPTATSPTSFPAPLAPLPSSLLSNDPTNSTTPDLWSNGLSTTNMNADYNEYMKQLGVLMNAFSQQPPQTDKSTASSTMKSSKSKNKHSTNNTQSSSSTNVNHDKASTLKTNDESHPRPTSTSSSSASSRHSSSKHLNKSSHSKRDQNTNATTSTKTPTTNTNNSPILDPLTFTATNPTAASGLTFPYFLPSLMSQTTGTNNNSSTTYPFSNLSSSLLNPTMPFYSFLSPDWFSSSTKLTDTFNHFNSDKSADSKDSTSNQPSKSKQSQKHLSSNNKHLPSPDPSQNELIAKSKKRAKSIRALTEEQESNIEKLSLKNQTHTTLSTNPSLLQSVLTDPLNINDLRENLLNLTRRSNNNETSSNRQTTSISSVDESRSNEDDDSDPNVKRRKNEETNEALVRIPLNRGWKRVTIVRAVTRTGVRGDVSYYAPCGRKLRSFQEIDRYLSKKNVTDLDRSNFTFSSKVHIGHFHEPKQDSDGKITFQESAEDEMVNRILAINPRFRRIRFDNEYETPTKTSTNPSPSVTPSQNSVLNNHQQQTHEENRKYRQEQEEMAKRAAEIKNNREAMRLLQNITSENSKTSDRLSNSQYQHNDFIKAIFEQQKLMQQQELERQQKLQQEQQEQERKRQELAYLKQLELKKRQEEKLLIIEQRKAEKNAEREKKIQEKYMEMVLAKEMKRITEDMQLRDLKPLPSLKPIENMRLSVEAFANALMIVQFLNNFKHIFQIPDNLMLTLNNFQQSSSLREMNILCQFLLNIALEDPGIPNPKKVVTNLGQKLSEIDITEHTFSEILRIYIRERNGFDDKMTQNLSDTSFHSLPIDEKIEILAFLCNELSVNKRFVEEVDHNLDEFNTLKHEKLEIERRLRRLKFEKSNSSVNNNNVKKLASLIREKDMNSSDNESPDESEAENTKNEDETEVANDPAAVTADDQDIETIDESKIDDLDKRLTLVTRKYLLIKRRVIEKQCRMRSLHLGQDRYRRRYWYFSHLPGIFVEGLTSGDISPNDIKDTVENATKQKLDKTNESNSASRSTQRKTKQTKVTNSTMSVTNISAEQSITDSILKSETCVQEDEQQNEQKSVSSNAVEDLNIMDLTAFCQSVKQDENIENDNQYVTIKNESSDDVNDHNKRPLDEVDHNDNLPLDLSCSKSKRTCDEDYWTKQHLQAAYPLISNTNNKQDQIHELNNLSSTTTLLNNIKQEHSMFQPYENLIDVNNFMKPCNLSASIKQEAPTNNFKEIEQTIREKFQYSQPLPIPDDVQSGWWCIQTSDELRSLIKCLAKRGQRERHLCRMLQRYSDIIVNSMKLSSSLTESISASNEASNFDNNLDEQQDFVSNDVNDNNNNTNYNDTHEMDVLNEIYNLLDRIIASSLHSRSYDITSSRKRLTYSDIQAKGTDVLDEAKQLLADIERNIERRYLKHPFVRKYEITMSPLNRINQNSTYHHTSEDSTNELVAASKCDEVPQQLERWRRAINECRTPAQLALCLAQLERCIAWERSIMRVYCEICNSDDNEEKLLLCDGCDHGTHTYCFLPPMSFIPPNDWYCYVCIGKAKGEDLCFVCGNKGDDELNQCEHCGKLFHGNCLKYAKQQNGKWLCVLCAANDMSSSNGGNTTTTTPTKSPIGRQTSRSINCRQTINNTTNTNTNGTDVFNSLPSTTNTTRNRTNSHRKGKTNTNESLNLQESHSNSSHADTTIASVLHDSSSNDLDDDVTSPTISTSNNNNNNHNNNNTHNNNCAKKKSPKKSKPKEDIKACKVILNELLKSDVVWPFQAPVDAKEHPEYYECIQNPMDFATIKRKMRKNQYMKRDEFFHDVELILNNCEYFNEDDSPVGQAGHLLRTLFQSQWTKQFG